MKTPEPTGGPSVSVRPDNLFQQVTHVTSFRGPPPTQFTLDFGWDPGDQFGTIPDTDGSPPRKRLSVLPQHIRPTEEVSNLAHGPFEVCG